MRRVKMLQHWREQQQRQFDSIQQEFGQINSQHQAHQQRLELLESLSGQYCIEGGQQASALMLKGIGRFRYQLDNLTNLQRHELAMSEVELRTTNERLVQQHCQVRMGEKIIEKRQNQIALKQERQQQKILDELSANKFYRQRIT
ncbi:flagellar FliJ family protein [Photobacterium kagoshimensis]|uniref:flagellar FliJ family protein n=1 Tax=Photobacterium kagoshimensis TaxID=2910242 RepID=UPI003D133E7B